MPPDLSITQVKAALEHISALQLALETSTLSIQHSLALSLASFQVTIQSAFASLSQAVQTTTNAQYERLESARRALEQLGEGLDEDMKGLLGPCYWNCVQWPLWHEPDAAIVDRLVRESMVFGSLGSAELSGESDRTLRDAYTRLHCTRNQALDAVLASYSSLQTHLGALASRVQGLLSPCLSSAQDFVLSIVHVGIRDVSVDIAESIQLSLRSFTETDVAKAISEAQNRPNRYSLRLQSLAETASNPTLSLALIDHLVRVFPANHSTLHQVRLSLCNTVYKDSAPRARLALESWAEGEALQAYYRREVEVGERLGDQGKGEGYRWALQVAESEVGRDEEACERVGMKLARRLYVSRKTEKWQEAESLLRRLLSAQPTLPPLTLLAHILIATSRYSEAAQLLQSLPHYSQPSYLRFHCALVALAQGKTGEFQQEFSEFVGKEEGEMAGTWLLGLVYYVTTEVMGELNGDKEVPAMFEPADWGLPAWGLSADCFPILPQLLELIQSRAIPHVPDSYCGFGLMRTSLDDLSGDFPDQLEAAMQGIEENTLVLADMVTMKAYYYHIEKNWDLAEKHYARALRIHQRLHPSSSRTFLALKKLALLYLHCNRLSLALSTFQSALELALCTPLSVLQIYYSRIRVGEVRVRLGQGDRGEEEYREALRLEGVGEQERAEGWLGLAKALECRGLVEDSIAAYQSCIAALEPYSPHCILLYLAYFKLASFLLTATRRVAEARECLEKAALVLGEAPAIEKARKRAEALETTNN